MKMEARKLILDLDIVLARRPSPSCIHPRLLFANNTREISVDLSDFRTNGLDHDAIIVPREITRCMSMTVTSSTHIPRLHGYYKCKCFSGIFAFIISRYKHSNLLKARIIGWQYRA